MPKPIIVIDNLTSEIQGHIIHRNLNLEVNEGEILALVGGSGSGKTMLLNCLLMLQPIASGHIHILGQDITRLDNVACEKLRMQLGAMFQGGALFSELTVLENVLFPMQQHSKLDFATLKQLALLKIIMAGLSVDAASKYPSELSGGMIKRAAVARSLALDPAILFLDEPSAGLDPITASALDHLILDLRNSLPLTIIIVTHDLDTLDTVPDRIAFLGAGRVLACAPLAEMVRSRIPEVTAYFSNPRARRTFGTE